MANLKIIPAGVRQGTEHLLSLTSDASEKVRTLLEKNEEATLLRVAIVGGGCNGLSYKLKLESAARRGDILVESGEAPVVVDSKSALYLRGTQLDYSSSLVGGGFKFSNPNAKGTCSCGESFNR